MILTWAVGSVLLTGTEFSCWSLDSVYYVRLLQCPSFCPSRTGNVLVFTKCIDVHVLIASVPVALYIVCCLVLLT